MALLVGVFAIVFGLAASMGSARVAVVLGGLLVGVMLLFTGNSFLLLALTILSLFVVGQLFYFGGLGQALWIPYGVGLLLYAKWLGSMFGRRPAQQLDALTILVVLFLVCAAFSIALNLPDPLRAAATGKNYIGLWSVFLLMAAALIPMAVIHQVWRLLWWALLFQLPIVVYQYFVVAPSRRVFGGVVGGVEWDAVVGGFGGHREGGGASGAMAVFVCLMAVYALARYRRGAASLNTVVLATIAAAICVLLAEVKVVVALVPLSLFVLLAPQMLRRPLLFLGAVILGLVLGFAVLLAYQSLHYADRSTDNRPVAVIERAFGYSLDPDQINMRSGEMGRVAAIYHWVKEAPRYGTAHVVFGHGPGASRSQSIAGAGDVALRYPFRIDRSSAVQLLWDVGVLGVFSLLAALGLGAWRAAVLAKRMQASPLVAAYLDTASVGLVLLAAMLFYGRDPFDVPALALLMAFLLGLVARQWRQEAVYALERTPSVAETRQAVPSRG